MHSRNYLNKNDFHVKRGTKYSKLRAMFPNWSPQERVVFVAPDPITDTARLSPFVLGRTAMFYGRDEAQGSDFFAYPNHFVVGGEEEGETRLLGPNAAAEWSSAWCRLDVWPSTHHVATASEPANLLTGALTLESTVLVWPARMPMPATIDLPVGPTDDVVRRLLGSHLREIWLYGDSAPQGTTEWVIHCSGGAQTLLQEAIDLLPNKPSGKAPQGCFWSVAPHDFLAQDTRPE